ncbi:hypothetical protein BWD12_13040 [Leptospira santarosai serovar Bananal]|uniref:Uncharacterized protein n=1 Tax=Leptospira santarosai TaxID=28183 RepID=A0AB73LMF8_9LEPT|nr:hypothetical protein BWD11_02175 [Leptospira santarosai serovar Grippotyphosa]ONF78257.1 hypothetical protein BWD12_13040 [Leptospira santarosai serovar Bananal]ONF84157.1 hypothetical protein BWD13_16725 [Leptospira santarosai serovar Grippotyphosa]ONF92965.1 hypothetical protein BWD14_10770 [Leptospira santarosai]
MYEFPHFRKHSLSDFSSKSAKPPQIRNFLWEFPQIDPKPKFSIDYNFDTENWYQYHNNQFIENSPVAGNVPSTGIFLKTFRKQNFNESQKIYFPFSSFHHSAGLTFQL